MKCPFCAEEIFDEAIKCKHCGSDLQNVEKKKRIDNFIAFLQKEEKGVFKETYRDIDAGIVRLEGPKPDFSFLLFILLLGIFYLIYHATRKPWYVTLKFDENGWYKGSFESNQKSLSPLFAKYKKVNPEFAEAVAKKREGKKFWELSE